ncbi:Flp pilus assembly protein TadB [Streptacidiphilus sp. MAP12-33]|uniref:type II secretion system F family protein n=1 Tax=Streptacidiphilus sp. MAP12-33 TaxID=3156266 RepID=UPI003512C69E
MNAALITVAALLSGLTAVVTGLVVRTRRRRFLRRAMRVGVDPARSRKARRGLPGGERRVPRLASAVLGAGVVALVGGPTGWVLGVALGALGFRYLPSPPGPAMRARRRETVLLRAQLPLTAELLAGCMASWCPPDAALISVAEAMPEPMAGRLVAAAVQLSMGADPESCWERLAVTDPVLAPLGRCLARAASSGAPPAAGLARLADAERASAAREAQARVRRAGVIATAPLGLCFLPAFVLVGVVPVVTGLAGIFLGRL